MNGFLFCFTVIFFPTTGSKHTFSYLEQINLEEKVLVNKLPGDKTLAVTASTTAISQNEDNKSQSTTTDKKTVTASSSSSSSWASLFKGPTSSSQVESMIKPTAENQSDKPSSILSIQNEQEKENEAGKADSPNLLTLISMAKDQRAIKLAGEITILVS